MIKKKILIVFRIWLISKTCSWWINNFVFNKFQFKLQILSRKIILCSPVLYFCYECSLAAKSLSTQLGLLKIKLREMLYPLVWGFLLCTSWLLFRRPSKLQRDLWITLYFLSFLSDDLSTDVSTSAVYVIVVVP